MQTNVAVSTLKEAGLQELIVPTGNSTDCAATFFELVSHELSSLHQSLENLQKTYTTKLNAFIKALNTTAAACKNGNGWSKEDTLTTFAQLVATAKAASAAVPNSSTAAHFRKTRYAYVCVWLLHRSV